MKILLAFALVALALSPAASAPAPDGGASPAAAPADVKTSGVNAFAFDLYRELAAAKPGNLFFSPFSISSALAMTASGAAGETLAQMEKTLRFGAAGEPLHAAFGALVAHLNALGAQGRFELSVANALFGQKGKAFLPAFTARLDRVYRSGGIVPLDFQNDPKGGQKRINDWVAQATRDKIKDLIPDGVIKPLTRLVLVNAIYFKGKWQAEFEKSATKEETFTPDEGEAAKVPLMFRKGKLPAAEVDGAKVVEIPYKENDLSMVAILPPAGTKLDAFAAALDGAKFEALVSSLSPRDVRLHLPRFKLESDFLLGEILKKLGMPVAFSDGADFSGMDGTNLLKISEAVHKAFVDVNEEGTEAAAATAVVMIEKSAAFDPEPPFEFRADRPFLFAIRENATGAILFLGRVARP